MSNNYQSLPGPNYNNPYNQNNNQYAAPYQGMLTMLLINIIIIIIILHLLYKTQY